MILTTIETMPTNCVVYLQCTKHVKDGPYHISLALFFSLPTKCQQLAGKHSSFIFLNMEQNVKGRKEIQVLTDSQTARFSHLPKHGLAFYKCFLWLCSKQPNSQLIFRRALSSPSKDDNVMGVVLESSRERTRSASTIHRVAPAMAPPLLAVFQGDLLYVSETRCSQ